MSYNVGWRNDSLESIPGLLKNLKIPYSSNPILAVPRLHDRQLVDLGLALARAHQVERLDAGLEITSFFFKPKQVGFLGFFGLLVFLVFLYICPEERGVFRVFSVSRILFGASRL